MAFRYWSRCTRAWVLVPLLALLPGASALADDLLQRAEARLQQGDAAAAFALLDAQETARAGDPVFDAAMGRAAFVAGQYTRAVMAWERVVATQPDNLAAQVELARALYAVGDKRGVQALSEQARARGVPVDAALSIDQFLVSYDRPEHGGRSTIKGHIELGAGHDSNVNAAPDAAASGVALPGVPAWSLTPEGSARSGDFLQAQASLRGRYVLDPRWSVVGYGIATSRHHGSAAARPYDHATVDASLGIAWRAERHELIASAQGSYYALDGSRLRTIGGILGEWIYRLDGFRQWGTFVQVLDVDYPSQPLRDMRRTVVGTAYSHVARNGAIGYAGAYGGREAPSSAGAEALGHRLWGLRAGGQVPLAPQWAAFASVDWEYRRYGAADPFFGVVRRDRQTTGTIGLSWVPAPMWRVTPQWAITRNASTLPITDYDRRVLSVTVRREF